MSLCSYQICTLITNVMVCGCCKGHESSVLLHVITMPRRSQIVYFAIHAYRTVEEKSIQHDSIQKQFSLRTSDTHLRPSGPKLWEINSVVLMHLVYDTFIY